MTINPAIEEKIVELAKIAHRFTACGQPDCEGCTYENNELVSEIRTALTDIYQLGVSESPLKDLLEARAWISNKIANHNHSYEFSATRMGALEEERDRLEKLIDSLTKTS